MANWDMARGFIKTRRDALASKSFSELVALEEFSVIAPPEALRPFQFTVYRQSLSDGSLKVIVEAWKSHFFGMWSTKVTDGFVISPSGVQRELSSNEL